MSDEDLVVTRQYDIGNEKNLPHPALFLIDRQGNLIWYYASRGFKVCPTASQVEAIIKARFSDWRGDTRKTDLLQITCPC